MAYQHLFWTTTKSDIAWRRSQVLGRGRQPTLVKVMELNRSWGHSLLDPGVQPWRRRGQGTVLSFATQHCFLQGPENYTHRCNDCSSTATKRDSDRLPHHLLPGISYPSKEQSASASWQQNHDLSLMYLRARSTRSMPTCTYLYLFVEELDRKSSLVKNRCGIRLRVINRNGVCIQCSKWRRVMCSPSRREKRAAEELLFCPLASGFSSQVPIH